MTKTAKTAKTIKTAPVAVAHVNSGTFEARMTMLKNHRLAATSKDLESILSGGGKFGFCEKVNTEIDKMGIDTTAIFATDRNPKVIKRFIQCVYSIGAGTVSDIDITTATIIYALHLAGENPLTIDALHYIGAGLKSGKVSPETKGVNRTTVNKIFGRVWLSTIPTQASRTVGKNGFLQLMGATTGEPGKQNQNVRLNTSHPLIVKFFSVMNNATQGQIDSMVGADK